MTRNSVYGNVEITNLISLQKLVSWSAGTHEASRQTEDSDVCHGVGKVWPWPGIAMGVRACPFSSTRDSSAHSLGARAPCWPGWDFPSVEPRAESPLTQSFFPLRRGTRPALPSEVCPQVPSPLSFVFHRHYSAPKTLLPRGPPNTV